jgi:hypothetical protein
MKMTMTLNLLDFLSPDTETSVYKGIPIEFRNDLGVRALMATGRFSVKYRGPRRKTAWGLTSYAGQSNCLKEDATSFAIYPKGPTVKYVYIRS